MNHSAVIILVVLAHLLVAHLVLRRPGIGHIRGRKR
jgi:hypothetical protein